MPPSHGRYTDDDLDREDRPLFNEDPAIIGAPPTRHRHATTWTEHDLRGKTLQAGTVVLVVVFNAVLVWVVGVWIGWW